MIMRAKCPCRRSEPTSAVIGGACVFGAADYIGAMIFVADIGARAEQSKRPVTTGLGNGLALSAAAVLLLLAMPAPLRAQGTGESAPTVVTPPPPSNFTLQPRGPQSQPQAPSPQGPVDPEFTQPRRAAPPEARPPSAPSATTERTDDAAPRPGASAAEAQRSPRGDARRDGETGNIDNQDRAGSAVREADRERAAISGQNGAAGDGLSDLPGFANGPQSSGTGTSDSQGAAQSDGGTTAAAPDSGGIRPWLAAVIGALLLLGGVFWWRRQRSKRASQLASEVATIPEQEEAPVRSHIPTRLLTDEAKAPEPARPAVQLPPAMSVLGGPGAAPDALPAPAAAPARADGGIVSSRLRAPPQPGFADPPLATPPPPRRDDGMITTRIARPDSPLAPPPPPQPPQGVANDSPDSGKEGLNFDFRTLEIRTTVDQIILAFHVQLGNSGPADLPPMRLSGTMQQAGRPLQSTAALQKFADIPVIAPGQEAAVRGEFRMPIDRIEPIVQNGQPVFVPLVRLAIQSEPGAERSIAHQLALLVGQEHNPPREKMAPVPLDQGEHSFARVGQRLLAAA